MKGTITGISGPTVTVRAEGLSLNERVYVGHAMLTGEVVRLMRGRAVVQVYEDPRGLGVGEPVISVGGPLTVRLGPGLLGNMLDGLQRPLQRMREETGVYIGTGKDMMAIDHTTTWMFHPLKARGDSVSPGECIGYVEEARFNHYIALQPGMSGKLLRVEPEGLVGMDTSIAELEDGEMVFLCHEWPVREPRPYLKKLPPAEILITGQRVIDMLMPIARGGTAIMPGGFGTGKTILEQTIAKYTDVDIVVYVGCGERGNEMADLIDELLILKDPSTGHGLMERTILVANTSNMPVAAREASIYTAVTMAEYYRDMGYSVLLLADSLSRWAEALREISTTLEEMPGEEGYPTYLASRLAGFFERSGVVETAMGRRGSLSMILSVSPPGADLTEPVTQACLRIAGSFMMLDTSLAHRRHFPAINWSQSYSLYEKSISASLKGLVAGEWEGVRQRMREVLRTEEELKEIAEVVGTEGLQDEDRLLLAVVELIRTRFLMQNAFSEDAFSSLDQTFVAIKRILDLYNSKLESLRKGASLDELLGDGLETEVEAA